MLAQRLLVDLELIGDFGLGDANGRSVLDERALVCGRHIFSGHFPLRFIQTIARYTVKCYPVRVLSRLFRRLVLQMLVAAHEAGRLQFFGLHAALALPPLARASLVVRGPRVSLAARSYGRQLVVRSRPHLYHFDQLSRL
jgi:hypothetical protein